MADDFIKDITPEEAVAKHEPGSMHCCTPTRWQQVAHKFDMVEHPWLANHLGEMTLDGQMRVTCIDTKGLTPEQVNYVLAAFYGDKDVGVMLVDEESPAAKAFYEAKQRADLKRAAKKRRQE